MAKLKLLVVDDEPGIRSGVFRILNDFRVDYPFMEEHFEFDLYEAATGEDAKVLIDTNPPDIILLDNKLPGIQGVELLEYINKEKLEITVVMITSYASLELAVQATRDGAYDFIPKPFTPQELRASLENITKRVFLRRMTKKLKTEGKQVRFQFLSVLSHELKAPLNAIEGYLMMIQNRDFGTDIKEYDQSVERALKRIEGMRSLILDLLDLTKIQSGKKNKDIKLLNLTDIAKSSIDTMRPYAIQRNITFNFIKNDEVFMLADAEDIEIVFNNFISNAVKYNKDNGIVQIYIGKATDEITIKITDTGIGLNQEEIEKIFGDFIRIKSEKTREISGSGLGLSIAKSMVEFYNGNIEVLSEPDKGSTFIVRFPISQNNQTI